MAGESSTLARDVDRLYGEGTISGLTEAQLLERFLVRNDEMAFEALVTRHGPMVLAVCRRVLRDHHEADDAFQATFLVLVRRAGTIRAALLGPWLHRVAYRVAVRAGKTQAKRLAKETPSSEVVATAPAANGIDRETHREIHEALEALPARYREPIVLCDLEGQTHDEAAKHLQWPIGSVKGRLSRGRDLLRTRLERRGVGIPSVAIIATLAGESKASVPIALKQATVQAATAIAAGQSITAGTISATAALLAQEVVRTMMIKKLATVGATLAGIALAIGGTAALARQDGANSPSKTTEAGKVADPAKKTELKATVEILEDFTPPQEKATTNGPGVKTGLQVAQELRAEAEKLQVERDRELDSVVQLQEQTEFFQRRIEMLQEVINATELFNLTGVSQPPAITLNNADQREAKLTQVKQVVEHTQQDLVMHRKMARDSGRKAADLDRAIDKLNARADAAADRPGLPNTVQVGDILVVEVLEALPGRPISGERIVRPDGTISLGFYGDLKVEGLTLREIKVKVIEHMRKYLTDESLGLIGKKKVSEVEFKIVEVEPMESDRVFVDQANWATPPPTGDMKTMQRKLDEVIRELDALKRRERKDLRGTPRS